MLFSSARSASRLALILFALITLSAGGARAQSNSKWPISLIKNTLVTLKIPAAVISYEKISVWSGRYSFTVDVSLNQFK